MAMDDRIFNTLYLLSTKDDLNLVAETFVFIIMKIWLVRALSL